MFGAWVFSRSSILSGSPETFYHRWSNSVNSGWRPRCQQDECFGQPPTSQDLSKKTSHRVAHNNRCNTKLTDFLFQVFGIVQQAGRSKLWIGSICWIHIVIASRGDTAIAFTFEKTLIVFQYLWPTPHAVYHKNSISHTLSPSCFDRIKGRANNLMIRLKSFLNFT